jgi:hypothetical protein
MNADSFVDLWIPRLLVQYVCEELAVQLGRQAGALASPQTPRSLTAFHPEVYPICSGLGLDKGKGLATGSPHSDCITALIMTLLPGGNAGVQSDV